MTEWQESAHLRIGDFSASHFVPTQDLLRHETIGWLATLVANARAEGRLPRPDEVTPRLVGPAALPTVLLVDVVGEPARYRIRLIGTKLARLSGRDNTGRFFDELAEQHGEVAPFYQRLLDHVRLHREAVLITADMFYRKQSWQHFRALWAPLGRQPDHVERIAAELEMPPPNRPVRRGF